VPAFKGVPAVIAALLDQVDLFETILANVSGPESPILAVERESPGIPQTVGPNLLSGVPDANEGVIRRDVIAPVRPDP